VTTSHAIAGVSNIEAQDFWSKLAKLVSKHHGYILHSDIEKRFGLSVFAYGPETHLQEFSFQKAAGWPFKMMMIETDKSYHDITGAGQNGLSATLSIDILENNSSAPAGASCLSLDFARNSLLKNRWLIRRLNISLPYGVELHDAFSMGQNELVLFQSNSSSPSVRGSSKNICVSKVILYSQPTPGRIQ